MSKPVPPGENIPACITSGSRPAGFFAAAMAVSTEMPIDLQLVLPGVIFADVRICASAAECEQPFELYGRLMPLTMRSLSAYAASSPVDRVALSAVMLAVVKVPVAVGQNISGSELTLRLTPA